MKDQGGQRSQGHLVSLGVGIISSLFGGYPMLHPSSRSVPTLARHRCAWPSWLRPAALMPQGHDGDHPVCDGVDHRVRITLQRQMSPSTRGGRPQLRYLHQQHADFLEALQQSLRDRGAESITAPRDGARQVTPCRRQDDQARRLSWARRSAITVSHGTPSTSPASSCAMRRSISASHAASMSSCSATLVHRRSARSARSSGDSFMAWAVTVSRGVGMANLREQGDGRRRLPSLGLNVDTLPTCPSHLSIHGRPSDSPETELSAKYSYLLAQPMKKMCHAVLMARISRSIRCGQRPLGGR